MDENKILKDHKKNVELSQIRYIPKKLKNIGIIDSLPNEYQPFAENIIKILNNNMDHISWDDNYNLILNKEKIPDTNIIKLFKYISNSLIITRETDKPKAADDFIKELLRLNIPESWIKVKIKKIRKKTQRGKGWIYF